MSPENRIDRPCSVARTIEVLGDRWSLLILREAFFGVRRFDVFQSQLGIARNILTNRLKHLVKGYAEFQQPVGIDDDMVLLYKAAETVYLINAGYRA